MNLLVTTKIQELQMEANEISERKIAWEKTQKPDLSFEYFRRKKAKEFKKENLRLIQITSEVMRIRLMGLTKD